ncbi:MAG: peptidyl-prolyl cis-trans isomerase [Gammaproteobacteria bacterium]|nr:peptidyl-prolyl cis-trans isomerase [Gammaproteobacteria bacterium]
MQEVVRLLGSDFLNKVDISKVGSWQVPVASGFGLHLVRLDAYIAGELPAFAVLRDNVLRDWFVEKGEQSNDAFYENLRKRYRVRIESSDLNATEAADGLMLEMAP